MTNNTNLQNPMAVDNTTGMLGQMPINPGVKPSGASVSFSPKSQSTITSVFGNPLANSYDRAIDGPVPIPQPIIDQNVPPNNF